MTLPIRMSWGAGPDLAKRDPRPTFAVFADPRRPETVRIVAPQDFAATFGSGIRFRRITLQITDDPVTIGIRRRLPWLETYRGSLVHAELTSPLWLRQLKTITEIAFERRGY